MMKFLKTHLNKLLSALFLSVALFVLFQLRDWLLSSVTIKGYWLVLIAIAPLAFFFLIKTLIGQFNQKFKTNDAVRIIADDRKFIVIRYHFWFPKYAICKLENQVDAISVNEKYLEPFQNRETKGLLGVFDKPNINRHVRTAKITKL